MSYNYNQATLVGRLVRDPDYRSMPDVQSRTTFTMAVNRYYHDGHKEADFIPVCLWGRLADVACQLLKKGSPVLVCGRIHVSRYEKEKEMRRRIEVVAETFQLLEKHDALLKDLPTETIEEQEGSEEELVAV